MLTFKAHAILFSRYFKVLVLQIRKLKHEKANFPELRQLVEGLKLYSNVGGQAPNPSY